MATANTIDQYLGLDADRFTAPMANALLQFTITEEVKQRAAELADKTNFGTITDDEHAEYLRMIELDEVLSVMQTKARRFLAQT